MTFQEILTRAMEGKCSSHLETRKEKTLPYEEHIRRLSAGTTLAMQGLQTKK